MRQRLAGKRVWISGASSGLGEAMAVWAADHGATCVLSARSADKLEALRSRLGPDDRGHLALPLDLTRPAGFAAAVAQAGAVDYLINNGGISQRATAMDTTPETVRRVMETNFFGHVELTRLVLPGMVARGGGHVAVTSSVVGHIGTPMRSAYAASKHALHGYYDSLRYEVERHGIGVTIICPGYIHTDISVNAVTGDGSAQGTMDRNQAQGMSAEDFAEKAWRGLLAGKPELHIGGTELAGIYLGRFAPGLLRRIVRSRPWDGEPVNQT